jgi:hypothetical protein
MGFLDKAKDLASKATDAASVHSDEIEDGIDKAVEFADDKTDGKYSDQIDSGADTAKNFVAGLDDDE